MGKNKETKQLKFRDLPDDLAAYFIKRAIFCLLLMIALLVFSFLSKMLFASLVLCGVLVIFLAFNFYNYYCVISGKVYVYKGYFDRKKQESVEIKGIKKNTTLLRGPCSIILTSCEEGSENRFVVPVGSIFQAEQGNVVTVYAKPEEIFQKDENTFYIDNPLLVKVTKI